MGTRIVIKNRTHWASPDLWQKRGSVRMYEDPDKHLPIVDPLLSRIKQIGRPYYDAHDDLNYRVVEYLDPKMGWCYAAHLCQHYRVSYRCILDWARRGYLEPAIELNSPTKRFLVRDPARVAKLASDWRTKQPPPRQPIELSRVPFKKVPRR